MYVHEIYDVLLWREIRVIGEKENIYNNIPLNRRETVIPIEVVDKVAVFQRKEEKDWKE